MIGNHDDGPPIERAIRPVAPKSPSRAADEGSTKAPAPPGEAMPAGWRNIRLWLPSYRAAGLVSVFQQIEEYKRNAGENAPGGP